MQLHNPPTNNSYLRGDIYIADLDRDTSNLGCEQKGIRPVIIIQNDKGNKYSSTVIVAIITSQSKKPMHTHIKIDDPSILKLPSTICLEQIKTIDKSRLTKYLGRAPEDIIENMNTAILTSLGIVMQQSNTSANIYQEVKYEQMKKQTIFDGQSNDWLEIAKQNMAFFDNIEQHISNLKYELTEIDDEIENILEYIELTNYNVAQGFKVYKMLREYRQKRKDILNEIKLLEALISNFDCENMRRLYQSSISKMQYAIVESPRKAVVGLD